MTTTRYWLSLSNFEVNLALRSEKELILDGGYPKISTIPSFATSTPPPPPRRRVIQKDDSPNTRITIFPSLPRVNYWGLTPSALWITLSRCLMRPKSLRGRAIPPQNRRWWELHSAAATKLTKTRLDNQAVNDLSEVEFLRFYIISIMNRTLQMPIAFNIFKRMSESTIKVSLVTSPPAAVESDGVQESWTRKDGREKEGRKEENWSAEGDFYSFALCNDISILICLELN